MAALPWFAFSPSPFTVAYWLLLAGWAATFKLKYIPYKRFTRLAKLTDGLFIVGLVVLSNDIVWVVGSLLKWGGLYPESVFQLYLCIGRNIAGVVLCVLAVWPYLKIRLIRFTFITAALYLVNVAFMTVWFWLAPSPAFTDWTFAIRHNYSFNVVFSGFLVSHILGKTLTALIYLSLWPGLLNLG